MVIIDDHLLLFNELSEPLVLLFFLHQLNCGAIVHHAADKAEGKAYDHIDNAGLITEIIKSAD